MFLGDPLAVNKESAEPLAPECFAGATAKDNRHQPQLLPVERFSCGWCPDSRRPDVIPAARPHVSTRLPQRRRNNQFESTTRTPRPTTPETASLLVLSARAQLFDFFSGAPSVPARHAVYPPQTRRDTTLALALTRPEPAVT